MTKKETVKKVAKSIKTKEKEEKVAKKTTKIANPKEHVKRVPNIVVPEYYDLPYRYNQTVVKILAQTPKILFIYWDISDEDKQNFINKYGKNFFNDTYPVLLVHNETQNYSFEINIDDFANSWYLNINDSSAKYKIELGRRAKHVNSSAPNTYIYITASNVVETPNDHILIEQAPSEVSFMNVKTKSITVKREFNKSKIYNVYKEIKPEIVHSMPGSGGLL